MVALKKGIFTQSALRGLTLDPDLQVHEWAEQFRILSSKGSAEPGRWRNERTPYLKEIMGCLSSNDPSEYIVFVSGTQLGKTECILNWAGEVIHLMPGPMAVVQSTLGSGEIFSKQRLQPMIDCTPVLYNRVAKSREREAGNTTMMKEFPGGSVNILTANSEDTLRSKPIRFLALDEVDMYPGWTVSKAIERTETFSNRKIFLCSSPKKLVDSIIWAEWLMSDQREYFIPCPECNHYQTIKWKNIKFEYDVKTSKIKGEVLLACENVGCGTLISENKKLEMLQEGKWISQNTDGKYPGFRLPQFYSVLGSSKWRSAVNKHLKILQKKKKGNPTYIEDRETWTNDVCAEPWEEAMSPTMNWEKLFNRREAYKLEPLNEKIILLVCGVDIQDDRIEAQVLGIGLDHETYVVEYKIFHGKLSDLEIWSHLDEFLLKSYRHTCGPRMRIMGVAVDTGGHYAAKVYEFTKTRYTPKQRYVFAIKGASSYNGPIIKAPSKQQGAYLFVCGTDTAKDHLSECLKIETPGPGYVHFSLNSPESYFQQLCSERKVTEWFKGKRRQVWKNTSRARNEALDTFVYAIVALNILQYWLYPNATVTQMVEEISRKENITLQVPLDNVKQDKNQQQPQQAQRRRRRVISKGVRV
jgi:phage terminase large subunit GpA-like protein